MSKSDLLRDQDTPMVLGVELNRVTLTPQRYTVRRSEPVEIVLGMYVPTPDFPPDPAPQNGICRDLIGLSSGTLATITGVSDYRTLEAVQAELVFFYLFRYDPTWESWIDVWEAFLTARKQMV